MKEISEQTFGEYVETLRRKADRSLRKCAAAIGVSAQFFSEVFVKHMHKYNKNLDI
jgi:predicted DNA-binding protein (UPF0278 family)